MTTSESLAKPETRAPPTRVITERKRAEEALRLIVEGTASAVGAQFFRALVKHLAAALEVRYAFIAELVDLEGERLRLISIWTGAAYGENFEYLKKGTPSEHVVGKRLGYFPTGVQELFPADPWLREMGIESYLAIPLFGSAGNPLGHLGVMHDDSMNESLPAESVLHIFASRAGAELDRKRMEETLRTTSHRLAALAENLPSGILFEDASRRILYANRRFCEMFSIPAPADALVGMDCRKGAEEVSALFLQPEAFIQRIEEIIGGPHLGTNEELDLTDGRTLERDYIPIFEDGQYRGHLWHYRDITGRKQAEEALQRAREELEGKVERQIVRRNQYRLTFREFTVLHLVAAGKADKEIAHELGISPLTAHKHVANILAKMDAASRTEAGVRAVREGLLD